MPGGPHADQLVVLQIEDPVAPAATPRHDPRRVATLAAGAYVLVRVGSILASRPFVTPDTASYTSGQAVRPPLGALLISTLGHAGYQIVSALVSTLGYLAVAYVLWHPRQPRRSAVLIGTILVASMLPTFHVYEHWLIPDSLLIGLCAMALALAWPEQAPRWRLPALLAVLVLMTLAKEIGVGLALLVACIVAIRWSWKTALIGAVLAGVLFATVVAPASDRTGRVLQQEPIDTQLTMNRFRVIVASLTWWRLDERLLVVNTRAAECGMTMPQLIDETFGQTDRVVSFRSCPELWKATDSLSQLDLLMIHARHPRYVGDGIARGFAPHMQAMSQWSGYRLGATWWLRADHYLAGLLSGLPLVALAFSLTRHRGRRLALVALAGNGLALAAILVDPSGQDRHAAPFRAVALMIALLALGEMLGRDPDPAVGSHDLGPG